MAAAAVPDRVAAEVAEEAVEVEAVAAKPQHMSRLEEGVGVRRLLFLPCGNAFAIVFRPSRRQRKSRQRRYEKRKVLHLLHGLQRTFCRFERFAQNKSEPLPALHMSSRVILKSLVPVQPVQHQRISLHRWNCRGYVPTETIGQRTPSED